MNVMILGDTHGNLDWFEYVIEQSQRFECKYIYQVGDFGYWEHHPSGVAFLNDLNHLLEDANIDVFFVDGNHENHDMLRAKYPLDKNGFRRVRSRIQHAERGTRWEIGGTQFLAFGGASSIDKAHRVKGKSWWAAENITDANVEKVVKGGYADVMLTHEAPSEAICNYMRLLPDPDSVISRRKMGQAVEQVSPKLLFHGHYHYPISLDFRGTKVIGLSNEDETSMALLTLPGLDVIRFGLDLLLSS